MAISHCHVANGDVAPAVGVKEGMGEGSGATQLHTADGDNGMHCHHLNDVAHHCLHGLAGGGDVASICWHCHLCVVRCMWAVDSNNEHGKRSGHWVVGFMNKMVAGGRKMMGSGWFEQGGGKMKENCGEGQADAART